MNKVLKMQFQLLFSNSSQVVYLLLMSVAGTFVFFIMGGNTRLMLSIFILVITAAQITPKLFITEKENQTFETLLTLPLSFEHIERGKSFFCFLIFGSLLYITYTLSFSLDFFLRHVPLSDIFSLRNMTGIYLFPLLTIRNLSIRLSLLSLQSNDSKACAMDATLLSFLYGIPCMVAISCIEVPLNAFIIISMLYFIIEGVIGFSLQRRRKTYKNKYMLSNLYKV
ncbi:MAG: hypothetical protein PWP53_3773 [Lacrimispora sp.]|jgi:ABC-type Na+ efflux pump permease subunit|nr:hypothetical protein [Lacrimispora sp.]